MKALKILALLSAPALLIANSGRAEPPSPAPTPSMPILRRTPNFAAWAVTFSKADQKSGAPISRLHFDLPQSQTVIKTDHTYHEQTTLQSGKTSERWIYDNLELKTRPENGQIVYVPTSEDPALGDFRYKDADFNGLEWLSMENYRGIKEYEGKPAYYFESKLSTDPAARKLTAYVSMDTQWPISSSDGWTKSVYQYLPPPAATLNPPDNFMKIFRQLEIDRRESQRGPGR